MSTKIFANGGKVVARTPTGVNFHAVDLQIARLARAWPLAWFLKFKHWIFR